MDTLKFQLPFVLNLASNTAVPPVREFGFGAVTVPYGSCMRSRTWGFAPVFLFQYLSVQFTVTLNGTPAVLSVISLLMPEALPGLLVCPGISSCSCTALVATTVTYRVPDKNPHAPVSVAVILLLLRAIIIHGSNSALPFISVTGLSALAYPSSGVVIVTCVDVEHLFQYWSVALTVMVNVDPAA